MGSQMDIDNLCEGMKEMFINHSMGRPISNGLDIEEVSNNSSLAVKVKSFIDIALMNNMNNELQSLNEVNPNIWQSYVSRIARSILESSQMSCTQENLNNMLETCTQELITRFSHDFENFDFSGNTLQLNLLSIDVESNETKTFPEPNSSANLSSFLRPHNLSEIAQNISPKKPNYIRVQSLNVLLSSQISDLISSAQWETIQKCLQMALCDESFEVFQLGLQMHAKLVQSSIPEATKESFLNILESLCQQYHMRKSDFHEILFQVPSHFRMMRLCSLLLIIIKDLTLNLPRFGEKRFLDMIENFVHLLTIQGAKYTSIVSPYNFIACLDPDASWLDCFVHSASSRRQLLAKLSQNNSFISFVVQDTVEWLKNPYLPNGENNLLKDQFQGKITKNIIGFSNFLHGLSLISKIFSFESGLNMFPVVLNKTESVRIQEITELILHFLNEQQSIEESLEVVFSDALTKLLVSSAMSLMKVKENQTVQALQILLEPLAKNPMTPLFHTISILDMLSKLPQGPQNCFFKYENHSRKKILAVSSSFSDNALGTSAQKRASGKEAKTQDRQNSLKSVNMVSDLQNTFCPIKIIISSVLKLLSNRDLRDMALTAKLLEVCANIFNLHEGVAILDSNKSQLLSVALGVLEELNELRRLQGGDNVLVERNCYLLYSSLQHFVIKVGATPLGFYLLVSESPSAVASCLQHKLQQPDTPWDSSVWRLFVMFAVQHERCAALFADDRSVSLAKSQLLHLWASLEVETDSTIEIDDRKQQLMTIMAACGSSLPGVMAIVTGGKSDDCDDDSEDTITEQLSEYRPITAQALLSQKTLLELFSVDFRVQETVLTVLNVFSSLLNNSLYLQAKLQIQDKLLQQQSLNRADENADSVIIDECSLLRHEILEKSFLPGPACVRCEPAKLYCCYPAVNLSGKQKQRPRTQHGELSRFLQETKNGLHDGSWLKQARKAYKAGCSDEIKCGLFVDLVYLVQKATVGDTGTGLRWPTVEQVENVILLPEERTGVEVTIRYGLHHRLLQPIQQNNENLCLLLRLTKFLFDEVNQNTFTGFDWFLSTIFLICTGNVERCQSLLSALVNLPCISFIWQRYADSQGHSLVAFSHLLESLISHEVPLAFNALQGNGISWWLLCQVWMRECFWRLLSWREVCSWLILMILHPSDYQLYFCVSILIHSEQSLLRRANDSTLWMLVTNPPDRLCLSEMIPHIDKLWKRYHTIVLPHLTSASSH